MRRRLPLNLTLAGMVVILAGLVWFLQPEEKPPPKPITPLALQQIKHVTLDFPDAETIRLERTQNGWRLRSPVTARVRSAAMDQILELAERKSKRSMKPAAVDPAALGLAPPMVRVTFNNTTVALGTTEPINDRTYARVAKRCI